MHRYTLALIAATLLFATCRGPEPQPETQQPLPIVTLHGKSCFELTTRDTVPIIDDTYMDVENEFTINWPSLDSFPPATRRALILLAFADSTSPTLRQAGQQFLAQTWVDDDDWEILGRRPIDSVRHWPTNNATLVGNMTDFGTLLQFSVHSEYNVAYAAHGTYYTNNLLVDRSTGAVVSLADLMDARLPGQDAKRPSVETLLHALFPMRYVLHLHPALVNGLTCAVDGAAWAGRLFADAVWIEASKPGYVLAKLCYERMAQYKAETGRDADCLLLQNHGIFLSDDNADALGEKLQKVLDTLRAHCAFSPDFSPAAAEDPALGERLAALYGKGSVYRFCGASEAVRFAASEDAMRPLMEPFTPDHIVYCKAHPLYLPTGCDVQTAFAGYRAKYGCAPRICYVQGSGFYAVSDSEKSVDTAVLLALDAIKIAVYSRAFGGALPQSTALTDFIVNWEVEAYRARQAQ